MKLPSHIVGATSNPNKLKELASVAREFSVTIVSPQEVAIEKRLNNYPDIKEDGETYKENARLKAESYMKWSGMPAIGDDSGLEVSALNSEPGMYSARYLGPDASYADRMRSLVERLGELEVRRDSVSREAQFRCALVLMMPDGTESSAESSLVGEILREPRGDKGFGYDPIVEIGSLKKTLAEVDFEVTCKEGFRGAALRALFRQFEY